MLTSELQLEVSSGLSLKSQEQHEANSDVSSLLFGPPSLFLESAPRGLSAVLRNSHGFRVPGTSPATAPTAPQPPFTSPTFEILL